MKYTIRFFGFLSLAVCTLFISCNNDDENNSENDVEAVIFGIPFGVSFCINDTNNCYPSFRLTDETLEFSERSEFANNDVNFISPVVLNSSVFEDISSILNPIPSELINGESRSFGCPDCADQGGFFVKIFFANSSKTYIIDANDSDDQSQQIIGFKSRLREALQRLDAF